MRVLIDECVDQRVRFLISGHECQTARFAGLSGLKNGRLLDAAEAAGFEVLLTVDQNIPEQQNFERREISVIVLCGRRIADGISSRSSRSRFPRCARSGEVMLSGLDRSCLYYFAMVQTVSR